MDTQRLYLGHCTGFSVLVLIDQVFTKKLQKISTSTIIKFQKQIESIVIINIHAYQILEKHLMSKNDDKTFYKAVIYIFNISFAISQHIFTIKADILNILI